MDKKKIFVLIILGYLLLKIVKKMIPSKDLINPVTGRITSPFGESISLRGFKGHNGTDIAVPIGTKVLAPSNGTILKIYQNDLGGKQLILLLDNGFKVGFAHLSKNDFYKIGEKVQIANVIALTGNTGHTTGAHLHFTLTDKKNKLINPESMFSFKA